MTPRTALILAAGLAPCAGAEPLRVTNASPFIQIAAPPVAEPSRLLPAGRSEWSLTTDWVSNATVSVNGREEVAIDGETVALTARWRRGSGRWQWGVEVGYLFQGGGVLDDWIDDFHELFGLPEGDRPGLVNDRLDYVYRRDGVTLIDVEGSSDGLSDLRLSAAWQAVAEDDRAVALRAQVKLPTGDSDDLLGSGGADVALYVDAARRIEMSSWTPQIYGGFGVLLSEEGDVLPELRDSVALFGHAGIAWPATPALTLNLQFDAHGPLYDSDLPEFGNALQISLGGSLSLGRDWQLGIGVVEDISTHSSPDVIFHFDLRRRAL